MPGRMVQLAPRLAPGPIEVTSGARWLLAAGKRVVRERGVWPDEDVVGHTQPIPQLHAALHRHAVAEHHVVLDEDVVADVAVPADAGAREDVGEGPDARPVADFAALAQPLRMDEHRHRWSSPRRGLSSGARTIAQGSWTEAQSDAEAADARSACAADAQRGGEASTQGRAQERGDSGPEQPRAGLATSTVQVLACPTPRPRRGLVPGTRHENRAEGAR